MSCRFVRSFALLHMPLLLCSRLIQIRELLTPIYNNNRIEHIHSCSIWSNIHTHTNTHEQFCYLKLTIDSSTNVKKRIKWNSMKTPYTENNRYREPLFFFPHLLAVFSLNWCVPLNEQNENKHAFYLVVHLIILCILWRFQCLWFFPSWCGFILNWALSLDALSVYTF